MSCWWVVGGLLLVGCRRVVGELLVGCRRVVGELLVGCWRVVDGGLSAGCW